ncbi:HAD family phosphatase [uncultured Bifidobacterium sp.]|uniref:HAD family hydrolase n=1 Tax=uncultured Bifidobacterium sp. TaxID=165187 RepID=UPI002631C3B4|nr:HAD family phosphatase [uncultured Bifidobacterium sp.]
MDQSRRDGTCRTDIRSTTDIVFDFCGVLVDWRPERALEGQYPQGVIDMFFDSADPYGFDHYDRLSDLGWSDERVLEDYEAHHGPAVAWVFRTYFEHRDRAIVGMIPGMADVLRDLARQGLRLWGLTNFTTEFVDVARHVCPELSLLRGVVVSSQESVAKPDPEIYRRAQERYALDPDRTVFIDDRAENVDAARSVGWWGIEFAGVEDLRSRLPAVSTSSASTPSPSAPSQLRPNR